MARGSRVCVHVQAVLDVCSSWVSHYPPGWTAGRVAGLGMNEAELARNKALTEFVVRDLNADPALPFADNSFDVVTNCVSVDYLTQPLEVMKGASNHRVFAFSSFQLTSPRVATEVGRVLKPGGVGIMSFSNRCFPTKAVSIWTSTGDLDHVWIVGSACLACAIVCDAHSRARAQATSTTQEVHFALSFGFPNRNSRFILCRLRAAAGHRHFAQPGAERPDVHCVCAEERCVIWWKEHTFFHLCLHIFSIRACAQ